MKSSLTQLLTTFPLNILVSVGFIPLISYFCVVKVGLDVNVIQAFGDV